MNGNSRTEQFFKKTVTIFQLITADNASIVYFYISCTVKPVLSRTSRDQKILSAKASFRLIEVHCLKRNLKERLARDGRAMDLTEGSETSAKLNLTPGKPPPQKKIHKIQNTAMVLPSLANLHTVCINTTLSSHHSYSSSSL
jgi:hypothetical protein